jgi:hypothetical protein
VYVGIS